MQWGKQKKKRKRRSAIRPPFVALNGRRKMEGKSGGKYEPIQTPSGEGKKMKEKREKEDAGGSSLS